MQVPNLPTDNLYKFMTLSGVALLIAAGYFGVRLAQSQLTWRVGVIADIVLAERVTEQLEAVTRDVNRITINTTDSATVQAAIDELRTRTTALGAQSDALELRKAELRYFPAWYVVAWIGCVLIYLLGITLVWQGCQLWWSRSQRYQDEMLKRQAELGDTSVSNDRFRRTPAKR